MEIREKQYIPMPIYLGWLEFVGLSVYFGCLGCLEFVGSDFAPP